MRTIRLGVNIDHVATIRNARGGLHPDPVKAALLAAEAGADGITAHLREDRRHIRDNDIARLRQEVPLPLNFEMAATQEMLMIALKTRPNAVCLVPEKRAEITTEGGLDVLGAEAYLKEYIKPLKGYGIRVSLFVDADPTQIESAQLIGADIVELHTGKYAENYLKSASKEVDAIKKAASFAHAAGLECHAGHGLTLDNAGAIAAIPEIVELNIGHFIIAEAIFSGLPEVIAKMKAEIRRGSIQK